METLISDTRCLAITDLPIKHYQGEGKLFSSAAEGENDGNVRLNYHGKNTGPQPAFFSEAYHNLQLTSHQFSTSLQLEMDGAVVVINPFYNDVQSTTHN